MTVQGLLAPCLLSLVPTPADAEIKKRLSSTNRDDGMAILWACHPAAILAGLVNHFYRSEVVDWVSRHVRDVGIIEMAHALNSRPLADNLNASLALTASSTAALTAIADLDRGSLGVPDNPRHVEIHFILRELALRGLFLCPLRTSLAPVFEAPVGPIAGSSSGAGRWCGAVKAHDGRLFFLPSCGATTFSVFIVSPHSGKTQHLLYEPEKSPETMNKFVSAWVTSRNDQRAFSGMSALIVNSLKFHA